MCLSGLTFVGLYIYFSSILVLCCQYNDLYSCFAVFNLPRDSGSLCKAIFSLLNSPVRSLEWVNSGDRLAVGFECGQVKYIFKGS